MHVYIDPGLHRWNSVPYELSIKHLPEYLRFVNPVQDQWASQFYYTYEKII